MSITPRGSEEGGAAKFGSERLDNIGVSEVSVSGGCLTSGNVV